MKNADMPASPVPVELLYEARLDGNSSERAALGLTKRELFAAMAMQGILASGKYGHFALSENSANWAVKHADALLAALGGGE